MTTLPAPSYHFTAEIGCLDCDGPLVQLQAEPACRSLTASYECASCGAGLTLSMILRPAR